MAFPNHKVLTIGFKQGDSPKTQLCEPLLIRAVGYVLAEDLSHCLTGNLNKRLQLPLIA